MPRLRGRSSWRSERRKPSKPRNACGSKPSRAPSSRGRKSYFPLKRSSWMRSTRKSLGNWPSSRMERPSCNRSSKRTPPIGGRGRSTATRKTPTRSVPRSGPVSAGRSTASGASSSRAVTGPTGLTCGTRRSSLTSGGTRSERSRRSYGRAGEPSDLVLPRTILATRHAVPPHRERKLSIRDGPRPRQESSPPLPRHLRADAPDGNSPNRAGHRRRRVQGGGARSRVEGLRGRPDRARDEPEPRSSVHPDHWVLGGRTPPDDRMVSGPVRRAGADGSPPPDARVRPPRGRHCESQDPAPALGLEGDSPVRPVHRGRPGNSEGRVGRNDSDGPERTDRPAAGLRPHRGLVLPPEGLASARGWSARSLGRKAPPARGGALRARPPALRPANPRLHRAEGAGGPEPSNHREREGECVAVRSHPGPLGGLRWNSPQWAETNSSRDSSWRASGRHSASGATPLRRRSQRSSKTQTSGS